MLDDGERWAYTTVQTFLHRLHEKGHVRRERRGRTWVYEACFTRDEVVLGEAERLARRVCGGRSSALVLGLVRSGRLTPGDLDELREVLDQAQSRKRERRKRR